MATVLGTSDEGRPVTAHFFPGNGRGRALVIGGVHGSERSAVEVAQRLLARLTAGARPEADTVVVPLLFPDHYAADVREREIPTNRNFPAPGESLASARRRGGGRPLDHLGRPILPENMLLIELIERFRPDRIANLHATPHPQRPGFFSDPHAPVPVAPGDTGGQRAARHAAAARTAADEALALRLAAAAGRAGANVAGNRLGAEPTPVWSGEVCDGTSLGSWAPAPVVEGGPGDRDSVGVITVELYGLADSMRHPDPAARAAETDAFAEALLTLFLRGV